MIDAESINLYSQFASDVLAGKEIATGLFGSLQLPDVPPNMALVTMAGALFKSDVCGAQGSRTLAKQVSAAASDPSIDAIIVLSEGCPGGQVDGTKEFADTIKLANAKKPVIGAVSGMACSAAIWALTSTAEIYSLSETDMIGCIGVMARMKNPKAVDAENSDIVEVISDLTPDKNSEGRDVAQMKERYINPVAQIFQDSVKEGRGSRLKLSNENILTGKTYIAKHATSYGLIDGVMPFNKIVARANFLSKQRKNK